MQPDRVAPYAPVVIKLLGGVLYHDDAATWNLLLANQTPVAEYLARIGLELYVNEADGFAFLRQPDIADDEGARVALPRLTRRDRLSYYVTLLCVLLRERLDQFDASNPESDRLLLPADELRELMRPFLREHANELTVMRKIDLTVDKVAELGFLRRQTVGNEEQWEVRRIIKARIDADKLSEIKAKLEQHADS